MSSKSEGVTNSLTLKSPGHIWCMAVVQRGCSSASLQLRPCVWHCRSQETCKVWRDGLVAPDSAALAHACGRLVNWRSHINQVAALTALHKLAPCLSLSLHAACASWPITATSTKCEGRSKHTGPRAPVKPGTGPAALASTIPAQSRHTGRGCQVEHSQLTDAQGSVAVVRSMWCIPTFVSAPHATSCSTIWTCPC